MSNYMKNQAANAVMTNLISPVEFFQTLVDDAISHQKIDTFPEARGYLVELLVHYVDANNLFSRDDQGRATQTTLAEAMLRATQAEAVEKIETLKRLGDTALYVSGFFGDSLSRKIVDIDYYVNIGGAAYGYLANEIREDQLAKVFSEYSSRFVSYMDLLTYISQKSLVQSNSDLLRLYSRYLTTGSELAKTQLIEKGLLNAQVDPNKKPQQ